ncbi:MAG TPA: transposase [Ktedonobacterales bacterium]|nr:transposase [Ktedonobacterales bacterium]
MPCTTTEWATFTASRQEAARLWGDLVVRHHRLRRLRWRWPSKARWQRWAIIPRRRYPGLSAQSVQQLIGEFCEAVDSCRQLRKDGQTQARYPWRKPRYHDVVYTNQDARLRDGRLVLPHGRNGAMRIRLPERVALPGRLLEVRLSFGVVRLICEVTDAPRPQQTVIGVDLGVNTLIAATDGAKVFLVSGRGVKAVLQWRNKTVASIQQAQSKKTKGSLRWKRLQRRKYQVLNKTKRQVRDATHKATHAVAEAFPHATCYVGEPFNGAAQRTGRVQAQQVSTACTRKLIRQLDYKTAGAITINEAYSSQTCPVCGERSKHRRVYRCPHCGSTGPRDAVGAVNILSLGQHGVMHPGRFLPSGGQVKYLRPWQRLRGQPRSSSGGHPARSSAQFTTPRSPGLPGQGSCH